jgi:hypothetical protein
MDSQTNPNNQPQQTPQRSHTAPVSPALPHPDTTEPVMPAGIPIPLTPSPPPYPEPRASRQQNRDHQGRLLQEQELTREILQIHCLQAHPEGYATRSILLNLAGRYGVVRSIQGECKTCYLIQCITTRIVQELARLYSD